MVPPTGIVLPRISPSAVAAQQPRNSVVGGNTIITNNARISNSGRNRPAAAEGGGGKQQRTSSAGGGNKAITDQQRRDETDDSINQVSTLIVKRDIDGLKLWQTAKKKILKYLQDRAIYQMVRRFIREQSCSTQIENGILLRHRAKTKDPIVQIVPRVLTVAATDPQILSGGSYRPSQAPGSNIQRFLAIDRQGTVWTFDYDLQQLRSEYMQFHLPSVYMDAQHQSFSIYRTRIRIECDQFQLMELRPTVYCAVSLENRAIRFYDARLELLLTFPVPHPVVKLQATVGDMVAVQSTCRLDIFKVTIKALQTQTLVKVKPHLIISPDLLPDQWILDFTICKHQSRLYILTHSHMFVYRSDSGRQLEKKDLDDIPLPRHASSLAYHERSIRAFDYSMNELHLWRAHLHPIQQIKTHASRQLVITIAEFDCLKVWHAETFHQVHEFEMNGFGLFRDFTFIDDNSLCWVSKESISMCNVNFLSENVQRFTAMDRITRVKCHHSGVEGKIMLNSTDGTTRLLLSPRFTPQTILLPTFDCESIISPYFTSENPCRTGELVNVLETCEEMVTRIAFYEKAILGGPHFSFLLGTNDFGWLFILDDQGRIHNRIRPHEHSIKEIKPWPERDLVLLINSDHSISIVRVSVDQFEAMPVFTALYTIQIGIVCRQVAVGAKCMLMASEEGSVEICEISNTNRIELPAHQQRENHQKAVTSAVFIRKTQLFITGSLDGTLKLWDCSNQLIRTVSFNEAVVSMCSLNSYGDLLVAFRDRLDMMPSQKYLPAGFIVMLSKLKQSQRTERVKSSRPGNKSGNRSAIASRAGDRLGTASEKRKLGATFAANEYDADSKQSAVNTENSVQRSKPFDGGLSKSLEHMLFCKVKLEMTKDLDRNMRHEYELIHTENRAKLLAKQPQSAKSRPETLLNQMPLDQPTTNVASLKLPPLLHDADGQSQSESEWSEVEAPPESVQAARQVPSKKPRKKLVLPKGALMPNSSQKVMRTSIAGKLVQIRIRTHLPGANEVQDNIDQEDPVASSSDELSKAMPVSTFKQRLQALAARPLTRQEKKRQVEEAERAATTAAAALELKKKQANSLRRKPPPRPQTPEFMRIRTLECRQRKLDRDSNEVDFDLLLTDEKLEHQWLRYFRSCNDMQKRTEIMFELYAKFQNGELEDPELALTVFCDYLRYPCPIRASKVWATFVETVLEAFAYFSAINSTNIYALLIQLASLKERVYQKTVDILLYLGFRDDQIRSLARKVYLVTHTPNTTGELFNFTERSHKTALKSMLKTIIIARNEDNEEIIDVQDLGRTLPRVSSMPSLPEILRSQNDSSPVSIFGMRRCRSLLVMPGSKDYYRDIIRTLRLKTERTDFSMEYQRFEDKLNGLGIYARQILIQESRSQTARETQSSSSLFSSQSDSRGDSLDLHGSRENRSAVGSREYSAPDNRINSARSSSLSQFHSAENFFNDETAASSEIKITITGGVRKQSRESNSRATETPEISGNSSSEVTAIPHPLSESIGTASASEMAIVDSKASSREEETPATSRKSSRRSTISTSNNEEVSSTRSKTRASTGVRFSDTVEQVMGQANSSVVNLETADASAKSQSPVPPKSARKPVSAKPLLESVSEMQPNASAAESKKPTAETKKEPSAKKSPFSTPLPKTPTTAAGKPLPFSPISNAQLPQGSVVVTPPKTVLVDIPTSIGKSPGSAAVSKPLVGPNSSSSSAKTPTEAKVLPNSADASKNVFKEENVAAENVRTATTLKSRPVIINNIPVQKSPSINEDKPNVYAKFAEHDPMAPSPAPPVVDSPEPVLRKLSGEPLNLLQDAVDASQTAVEQKNKARLFDPDHELAKSTNCLSTSLRDRPPMLPRFPSDSIIYESTPVPSREPSLREIDSQGSLIEYIKQRKVELEEELGRMRALKATQIQAKKVKRLPKTYWVGQLKPRVDVRGKFISLPTVKQMDPFTSAIAARENRASKDGDGNSGGSNESLQHQQPRLKRRSTCAPTIIPAVFNEQALPVPVTRPFMPAIEYFEIGMLPESTGASNLTTMQQQ